MTDLEKLKADILEDGVIDEDEVKALEAIIYDDGDVDREEIDLLVDLRNNAKEACQGFEDLFFRAMQDHVLADGVIDKDEVKLLDAAIFSDDVVDDNEKQLLRDLKEKADGACPEFDDLYSRCLG